MLAKPHILALCLKEAREKVGLSQKRLGVLAGIDEFCASPRMNQYERGKHIPDVYMVERLASVLNVPVPYLYREDDLLADYILLINSVDAQEKESLLLTLKSKP